MSQLRLTTRGTTTCFLHRRLSALSAFPAPFLGLGLDSSPFPCSRALTRHMPMLHCSAAAMAADHYSASAPAQPSRGRPRNDTMQQHRDRRDPPRHTQPQPEQHFFEAAETPVTRPTHEFFVTCHPGLEPVVAKELQALGIAHGKPGKAGVAFWTNDVTDGYRACLWLRSAIRVLLLLSRQQLDTDPGRGYRSGDSLYEATRLAVQWQDLILPDQTFAVDSRVWSCTDLTSSHFASLRVKDAICDALRDARAAKPAPPPPGATADVPLYVACHKDTVSLFRDLSGTSLHRRGYRDAMHKAPLNEAAAAGALLLAGWQEMSAPTGLGHDAVLADPMCGSGTLLSEAALIARNVAPGLLRPSRTWPFRRWPDADQAGIRRAVQEARDLARPWRGRLLGNDVHPGALELARRDAKTAGIEDVVAYRQGDCKDWRLEAAASLVVTNPPWGLRLNGEEEREGERGEEEEVQEGGRRGRGREGEGAARRRREGGQSGGVGGEGEGAAGLEAAWASLSEFLRTQCRGTTAYILSGNQDAFNTLRVKSSRKDALRVGGVDVKLHQVKMLPLKPAASTGLNDDDRPTSSPARATPPFPRAPSASTGLDPADDDGATSFFPPDMGRQEDSIAHSGGRHASSSKVVPSSSSSSSSSGSSRHTSSSPFAPASTSERAVAGPRTPSSREGAPSAAPVRGGAVSQHQGLDDDDYFSP